MSIIYIIPLCIITNILLVYSVSRVTNTTTDTVCPVVCKCNAEKNTVVCSSHGRRLKYIPDIPSYVLKLTLDNNYFLRLRRRTFLGLSGTQLSELRMRNSNIINVDNDTFIDLQYLRSLDFEANRRVNYTSLKFAFASLRRKNISLIDLSKTDLNSTQMSLDIFVNLAGRTVDLVLLRKNNIRYLSEGSLRGLKKLRRFDISNNLLEECDMALMDLENLEFLMMGSNLIKRCDASYLPRRLKKLQLGGNYIERVPNFCSSFNTSLLPMLQSINLDNNEMKSIEKSSFLCLDALNYLNLGGNKISSFPSHVFKLLQNLKTLHLINSKDDIDTVDKEAFSIPTLTKFLFHGNGYNFRPLERARKASLGKNKNLEILDLSRNKLPGTDIGITLLLGGLSGLKQLKMINVAWTGIPNSFFKILPNLEELSLSKNRIGRITSELFSGSSRLKLLRLDANGITNVGPRTFPELFWEAIQKLDISGNPFACNCDLLWFRDTLKQSRVIFLQYPNKYECLSPDERKGQLLSQFDLKDSDCKEESVIAIAIISSSSSLALVFLVAFLTYRFRWQMRYFIYLWRYKDSGRINMDHEDFTYDAFVIYPEEDTDFVHDILLQKLEIESNLRLCIHSRDFQPGKSIIENIVDCISSSRRVFVVISPHFNNSKWCNFELLVAQDRWLNNESSVPLIIVKQEVDNAWIKREIRALMKTTTYAKWTDDVCGQELFWHQIISSVKGG